MDLSKSDLPGWGVGNPAGGAGGAAPPGGEGAEGAEERPSLPEVVEAVEAEGGGPPADTGGIGAAEVAVELVLREAD